MYVYTVANIVYYIVMSINIHINIHDIEGINYLKGIQITWKYTYFYLYIYYVEQISR